MNLDFARQRPFATSRLRACPERSEGVTKVSFVLLQTPHKLNQLFSIMLFHARRGGPCLPVFGKWVYNFWC